MRRGGRRGRSRWPQAGDWLDEKTIGALMGGGEVVTGGLCTTLWRHVGFAWGALQELFKPRLNSAGEDRPRHRVEP